MEVLQARKVELQVHGDDQQEQLEIYLQKEPEFGVTRMCHLQV